MSPAFGRGSRNSLPTNIHSSVVLRWRYLWIKRCVDARKRALTERGNTRGGATKKREISHDLLSINLHFLVVLFYINDRSNRAMMRRPTTCTEQRHTHLRTQQCLHAAEDRESRRLGSCFRCACTHSLDSSRSERGTKSE